MDLTLYFAREVKVNIRLFVSLKTEESFKRNFVTVTLHRNMAIRAILCGKVKARTYRAVENKLAVLAFFAIIVRRKRINLGNTAEMSGKR